MYNGIGLTTPRGSGTNGHVQRNWAFVRPGKKDTSNYRSEEDIKKLDATLNRPPNKEILDHDRKRKVEVKCLEFEEILEKQGISSVEIKAKVDSYRKKLMGQGKSDLPKDEFGRIVVRDTHQIAEAQQEKNAKLREAFNISEYFVEGSSFDSDRKAKEDLTKSLALQKELDTQRDHKAATAAKEKESSKRYALVRTPSIERNVSPGGICGSAADNGEHSIKKKKKKKTRGSSASPERKRDKKKKSKKRKKESKSKKSKKLRKRKSSESDSNVDNDKDSLYEGSDSESEADVKKCRKKSKKDKKKRDRRPKKKERSSLSEKSRSISPYLDKRIEDKTCKSLIGKKSSDSPFRSLSKEKSHNPKESESGHYESSRERRNKRSPSRNDRNESQQHTFNRCHEEISFRRSRSYIELNDRSLNIIRDSDLKRGSRPRDDRSRERNENVYNNRNDDSRSRPSQKFRHDSTTERIKDIKRKNSDEYPQKKRDSPSVEKRKKYSCSPSPSLTQQNRNSKSYAGTAGRKCSPPRKRSRTPRRKSQDSHSKVKKSRSRSTSVNENLQKRSLTPPPKEVESKNNNENTLLIQEKCSINSACLSFKDKTPIRRKSRSRTASTSSSNSVSTNTKSSKSRTPSRKVEDLDKPSISKNSASSLIELPTSGKRRSRSKSRNVLNENITKDKQRSDSKSRELEKLTEKREVYKNLTPRTPPPSKVEKKVSSPRSSRDSSELSYSPARRNPERYRDILENTRNLKTEKSNIGDKDEGRKEHGKPSKQHDERERDRKEKAGKNDRNHAKPVVHLQSQSDDDSDVLERNTEKILDEFQESKRERELKDLKMLEQLKSGIAAKAKEKIKTIEKMAASTSVSSSSHNSGEVSDKLCKMTIRNSLNDFLAANNVAPAVVATCSPTAFSNITNSPPGAIYPQTLEEIKKEQESLIQLTETSNHTENNNINKDNETQASCKKFPVTATGHALYLSPTASPVRNNVNVMNRDKDRKRERDYRERERDRDAKTSRENTNFNKDRYLERRQKLSPNIYNSCGGGVGGGVVGSGGMVGSRRNNTNMHHISHRQQRLNLINNSGGVGGHHHHPHSQLHPHHHYPNHQIINNHHNSSSSTTYIANNSSTNLHSLMCNHANNSTNISFNRPSRINNTPLITAAQFNNQMLSKQSNSILVNRRDHRTALNLGLSGTPCTNFSNSNLLLTKANTNTHHLHATAVGHAVGGGHHHQHHHHHHHHHHGQNATTSSGGSIPSSQITDRILMAASIAAAQRHSLGGVHSAASNAAVVAAAKNLNFLQHQNKPKLVIKPFKINDSQPLVAALADSSLVDAIVSKVSTATVAAAESAARRSRSRSRRSHSRNRSRNRHEEKASSGASNSGGGGGERDGNRRHSTSRSRSSRSSSSSRSRSRSHSRRSSRSHSSQSSSSSHSSSRSSSSSSFGSSRSGTRSPSIPRRRGSPSFLDRRRITSARKRPIPYHRKLPSDVSSCYCSSCCSRDSSPCSRSPSRDSRSPPRFF